MYGELNIDEILDFYYTGLEDIAWEYCKVLIENEKSDRCLIRENRKFAKDDNLKRLMEFSIKIISEGIENKELYINEIYNNLKITDDTEIDLIEEVYKLKINEDSIVKASNEQGILKLKELVEGYDDALTYEKYINSETFGYCTDYGINGATEIHEFLNYNNSHQIYNLIVEDIYKSNEFKLEVDYINKIKSMIPSDDADKTSFILRGAEVFLDSISQNSIDKVRGRIKAILEECIEFCNFEGYGDDSKEEFMRLNGYLYDDVYDRYIDEDEYYNVNIEREKKHLNSIYP